MNELTQIIHSMRGRRIIVAGDIMLDRFVYGAADRISPESPVPVLLTEAESTMLGGAGNVAANLCALGVKPVLLGTVGNDVNAEALLSVAKKSDIAVSGIVTDETRPTTLKTRFLARGQQLLRVDSEKTHPVSNEIEAAIFAAFEKELPSAAALILSDYGKGVLTSGLIERMISAAKAARVPVLVDPKGKEYGRYKGADYVTPNRKELAEASSASSLKTDEEIIAAAQKIITGCGIANVLATRSEDGLSLVSANNDAIHHRTTVREVFDVSGAGDTVIGVFAAAIAAGAKPAQAAELANIAGGVAVSKIGTAAVSDLELEEAASGSARPALNSKFESAYTAKERVDAWKKQGLKVGFTNGCFDILHQGHVGYLAAARAHCDRLIVGLNHDASVRILKGPTRPVNPQDARAAVMSALESVDMVVFFGAEKAEEDNTPCALIAALQPDIFFKGGDYKPEQLPEAKVMAVYGGEVAIMPFHEGFSTTSIIEKTRTGS
ncbi:MAG: bifunctional heptose 7-phosphate kinase/heptose 1-phosphate adenyltransferase [Micavibrio aeruginosavorus]|uniref:Bifunctional protein HldE n=1 Tax=Micavibrio aeruginosavorus TaxID=349221 RepID=A0A2W5BXW0_9BACT|nr:MAG: bifunctional heptose 7-phosphate kinase/heptose 1-phosphate adenyltransferase [Micavibrio aeruginosavorus]